MQRTTSNIDPARTDKGDRAPTAEPHAAGNRLRVDAVDEECAWYSRAIPQQLQSTDKACAVASVGCLL